MRISSKEIKNSFSNVIFSSLALITLLPFVCSLESNPGNSNNTAVQSTPASQHDNFWIFTGQNTLYYEINQTLISQRQLFDQTSGQWVRTQKHSENISGECILNGNSNNSADGRLYLKLDRINNSGNTVPLKPRDIAPKLTTKFSLSSEGLLEYSSDTKLEETLLIIQLAMGGPTVSLQKGEKKTLQFKKYSHQTPVFSDINGSIVFKHNGFERRKTCQCAVISCQVDLISDLDKKGIQGRTEWKGSGQYFFALNQHRLHNSTWQIVKLTTIGTEKTPSKIIEYITIEVEYMPQSKFFTDTSR